MKLQDIVLIAIILFVVYIIVDMAKENSKLKQEIDKKKLGSKLKADQPNKPAVAIKGGISYNIAWSSFMVSSQDNISEPFEQLGKKSKSYSESSDYVLC